jgi:superfamily II DNA or RNA helicase
LRIGFTATPQRLSGEPLSLYDILIQGVSTKELIKRGNIAPFDYYAPCVGIDLSGVETIAGEYNNKQLSEVMCQSRLYGDYIKAYRELADGRQAVAYCVSQKHAKDVCKAFNGAGISAVEIDSQDAVNERVAVLNAFKAGEFKILCNCNLISEGITIPQAEVVLMLRPTQSVALFIQQGMRALTPAGGKRAVILDCVGNWQRHGCLDDDRQWSLKGHVKHKVTNPDGTFSVRSCPRCFKVFKSNLSHCPYCGAEYVVKGRELKQVKEVELKKIEAEQAEALAKQKKAMRMEVGKARTMNELRKIAKARGYQEGWVYRMSRAKGILY